jgi:hypothetical protein
LFVPLTLSNSGKLLRAQNRENIDQKVPKKVFTNLFTTNIFGTAFGFKFFSYSWTKIRTYSSFFSYQATLVGTVQNQGFSTFFSKSAFLGLVGPFHFSFFCDNINHRPFLQTV